MDGMKGLGRTIATFVATDTRIELLAYPDGSMGIMRNAAPVGIWEQAEQEECVRTFMDMGTARESISALVLVRPRQPGSSPGSRSYVVFPTRPDNN